MVQMTIFMLTTLVCWVLACRRFYEAAGGMPLYRLARRLPGPVVAEMDASLAQQSRTAGSPELAAAFRYASLEAMLGSGSFALEMLAFAALFLLWHGPWAWLALAMFGKDLGLLAFDFLAIRSQRRPGEGLMAFIRRLPWWLRAVDRVSATLSFLALLACLYHAWSLGR